MGIFNPEGSETLTDNLYISIPILSAFGSALAAIVSGIISIIKFKEKSLLIYITIAIGLLITLFIISKLATPH